jgi:hypothetical protein
MKGREEGKERERERDEDTIGGAAGSWVCDSLPGELEWASAEVALARSTRVFGAGVVTIVEGLINLFHIEQTCTHTIHEWPRQIAKPNHSFQQQEKQQKDQN